jgi:hypothetical protein
MNRGGEGCMDTPIMNLMRTNKAVASKSEEWIIDKSNKIIEIRG